MRIRAIAFAAALAVSAQVPGELPVIGCASDGQTGPRAAPPGNRGMSTSPFAVYRAAYGPGITAPKGWHCIGTYGSGGTSLIVSPSPIDRAAGEHPSTGIVAIVRDGQSSGRYDVAEAILRYFPTRRGLASEILADVDKSLDSYPSAPDPGERVVYLSDAMLHFTREGRGAQTVHGIVALSGPNPDLIRISIRLPRLLPQLLRLNGEAIQRPPLR